mmetsp:Transcript_1163/g.1702  ORF Transcript_1163/g.1702 Transcript_1163/m.1702 type:complete len:370 (-) Transcript_1163:533-1642(-)
MTTTTVTTTTVAETTTAMTMMIETVAATIVVHDGVKIVLVVERREGVGPRKRHVISSRGENGRNVPLPQTSLLVNAYFLTLRKTNMKRFTLNFRAVHLTNSSTSIRSRGKTNKSKTAADTIGRSRNLDTVNDAKRGKQLLQLGVIEVLRQKFDINILVRGVLIALLFLLFTHALNELGTFNLGFVEGGIKALLAINSLSLKAINSLLGFRSGLEIDVAKLLASTFLIPFDLDTGNLTILSANLAKATLINIFRKELDVYVSIFATRASVVTPNERLNSKRLAIKIFVIKGLHCLLCVFFFLEVDETVTPRHAVIILADFQGRNVTEFGENPMEFLMVNRLGKILDKQISSTMFTGSRVARRPHNTNGLV